MALNIPHLVGIRVAAIRQRIPVCAVLIVSVLVPSTFAKVYAAVAACVVLLKLGGRFSRNAENASLASADGTRSTYSWFSIFTASLSWSIELRLMSRLQARNAPLGFAASFCAVAVAVASRSRSGPTRAGTEKLVPNSGTRARLINGIWNFALSPA